MRWSAMMTRRCGYCRKSLEGQRKDAVYCSPACRAAAHRASQDAQRAEREDCLAAAEVRLWIDGQRSGRAPVTPESLYAAHNDRWGEHLWDVQPSSRRFGLPNLRAAVATVLPKGCCRWGLAAVYARRVGLPAPEYSRALRILFGGDPCQKCLQHMMSMLAAKVHPAGMPTRAPARATSASSSAPRRRRPMPNHLHSRDCSPCAWARAADALTASAVPVPARVAAFAAEGRAPHSEYRTMQIPDSVEILPSDRPLVHWRRTGAS
jgi:hypothetical protein